MFKALNQGVDEDGFICVIAKDFYSGFVAEDWTLDQLLAHVAQQGNLGSIFIAYPGPNHADAPLLIDVPSTPSQPFREALGVVKCGPLGLWLTDYTQLTMAAQYSDTSALSSSALHLPVPEGTYLLTLTQQTAEISEFQLSWKPAPAGHASGNSSVAWFS